MHYINAIFKEKSKRKNNKSFVLDNEASPPILDTGIRRTKQ